MGGLQGGSFPGQPQGLHDDSLHVWQIVSDGILWHPRYAVELWKVMTGS